jgi:hypothetical protein
MSFLESLTDKCSNSDCDRNTILGRDKCGRCISKEANLGERKPCWGGAPGCTRLATLDGSSCKPCKNRRKRELKQIRAGVDPQATKRCEYCGNNVQNIEFAYCQSNSDFLANTCYPCVQRKKTKPKTHGVDHLFGCSMLSVEWQMKPIVGFKNSGFI